MANYKDLRIENVDNSTLEVIINEGKIQFILDNNFVFTFDSIIDAEALIYELKEKINIIESLPF